VKMPEPIYDGHDHEQPWWSDTDATYKGCALPIGRKAHFWREYFFINIHERVQYRSLIDCILRDFAEVERKYLAQQYRRPLLDRILYGTALGIVLASMVFLIVRGLS
jgi:hypothetical protein